MPVNSGDPIDHDRTHQPRAGVAFKDNRQLIGYLLIGAAVGGVMVSLFLAGIGHGGGSTAIGILALASATVGWLWLYLARRRVARLGRGTPADSTRNMRSAR